MEKRSSRVGTRRFPKRSIVACHKIFFRVAVALTAMVFLAGVCLAKPTSPEQACPAWGGS